MITIDKIVEAVKAQSKQGSCKACRWCGRFGPGQDPYVEGATHWCMVQAAQGINAIHFRPFHLDNAAYSYRCDVGSWEGEGGEHIPYCLAYQPGYAGTLADDPEYGEAASEHWLFMRQLARAMNLTLDIQYGSLAKLTAKLNAATESLPAAIRDTAQTEPSAAADKRGQ